MTSIVVLQSISISFSILSLDAYRSSVGFSESALYFFIRDLDFGHVSYVAHKGVAPGASSPGRFGPGA